MTNTLKRRPRYRTLQRFEFSAAHHLPALNATDPCSGAHIHTYSVEIVLEADHLSFPGVVADNAAVAPLEHYIATRLDQRYLNRIVKGPPTCEVLAEHLANMLLRAQRPTDRPRVVLVRVSADNQGYGEFHPPEL